MPIIKVSISDLGFQDIEKDVGFQEIEKEAAIGKIVERLTESTVRVLKKDRELVVVKVEEGSSNAWFVSGSELSPSASPIFEVEIKVTEGTNSQEEVSTWVREVFETMKQILGEGSSPNYISVQQIPQEFWGYNGLTQYGRKKWAS
ncbi:hypothetical protein L861_15160 [Litchfieldella anticariensis FP35 = DSM 16096]|uniref:Uncharacterized protein n=1 Tax=Litchfieldella anticariensis (strain DSM 16096 / CECT 5854 / CIP 108499 / LMG 22089 / FP35) TaxID=1121939 RepID=S2KPI7_LITA3|nr:tautomerase family protein [Halomonas anticariensis]EPC02373.1 hypothetical protein L861_15160 [Halomonas anticariensis FP35 = DSM 16096]